MKMLLLTLFWCAASAEDCFTWDKPLGGTLTMCYYAKNGKEVVFRVITTNVTWIGVGVGEMDGGGMRAADMGVVTYSGGGVTMRDMYSYADKNSIAEDVGDDVGWAVESWAYDDSTAEFDVTIVKQVSITDTQEDRPILIGPNLILSACGTNPVKHDYRGRHLLTFFEDPHITPPPPPSNIRVSLEITIPIVTSSALKSCRAVDMAVELPDILATPHHLTGFRLSYHAEVVEMDYTVHACSVPGVEWQSILADPGPCPKNITQMCEEALFHGTGKGEEYHLPKEAGFRFGASGHRYLLLHIDSIKDEVNETRTDELVTELFFTTEMRQHDAQVVVVGDIKMDKPFIAYQEAQVDCPSACTAGNTGDVTVFGTLMHTTIFGAWQLNQYRNNTYIKTVTKTEHMRYLTPIRTAAVIKPGDDLRMTCGVPNGVFARCTTSLYVYPREVFTPYCGYYASDATVCGEELISRVPSRGIEDIEDPLTYEFGRPTPPAVPANETSCATLTLQAPGDYKFCWTTDGKYLTLEVTVKTTGWVGFGLSEADSGSMGGSDMATVEWMDDGTPFVTDRYAVGNSAPLDDECGDDNWLIRGFSMVNGVVTGTLVKPLTVHDTQRDRPVLYGENRIVLAYGTEPEMAYHGSARLATSIDFFATNPGNTLPGNMEPYVELKMANYTLPDERTIYACQAFDMEAYLTFLIQEDYQAIRFKHADGISPTVHSMVVYSCIGENEVFKSMVGKPAATCPSLNTTCHEVLYSWAVGAGPTQLPDEAGFRFSYNNPDHYRYLMLQVHYDNRQYLRVGDSSGVAIGFTRVLREHDAQTIIVGDPFYQIPAIIPPTVGDELFSVQADCPGECTSRLSSSVNIFGVVFDMHEKGRRALLNLWSRDAFIKSLVSTEYYGSGFQNMNVASSVLLKGDELHAVCSYQNVNGPDTTFGGSAEQEKCVAYVYVYPKTSLTVCGYLDGDSTLCGWQDPVEVPQYPTNVTEPLPKLTFGNATSCQWTTSPDTSVPTTAPTQIPETLTPGKTMSPPTPEPSTLTPGNILPTPLPETPLPTTPSTSSPMTPGCLGYSIVMENDYVICPEVDGEGVVTLRIKVMTTGWVGFGVSEVNGGGMRGADMFTLEWESDDVILTDRYAAGEYVAPVADECGEGWELVEANRTTEAVEAVVRRKAVVEDYPVGRDRNMTVGTPFPIVLAYGDVPKMTGHAGYRLSAQLAVPLESITPLTTPSVDLTVNFTIPQSVSSQHCATFAVADMFPTPAYVTGFDVVEKLSRRTGDPRLHHMLLEIIITPNVEKFLWHWVPGDAPFVFPQNSGYNLTSAATLKLCVHYENFFLHTAIRPDLSGVAVYYTQSVQNEIGVASMGYVGTNPELKKEMEFGCTNCLSWVAVHGVMLHMGDTGGQRAQATVYHNGIPTTLSKVDYWDYRYQKASLIAPVDIEPSDGFTVRCEFDDTAVSQTCLAVLFTIPPLPDCVLVTGGYELCPGSPDATFPTTPSVPKFGAMSPDICVVPEEPDDDAFPWWIVIAGASGCVLLTVAGVYFRKKKSKANFTSGAELVDFNEGDPQEEEMYATML